LALTTVAVALVIVGAILASTLDDWSGVPVALAFTYLGVSLLLLATHDLATATVSLVAAGGIEAILIVPPIVPPSEVPSEFGIFALRSVRLPSAPALRSWLRRSFRLRWFDLSATAVAVVGAADLAAARPVLGGTGVDLVVDVLFFTGFLYCLIVRPPRLASGLLFLMSAGSVLVQETGQTPTRPEILLLIVAQLSLAIALAHVRAAEDLRASDKSAAATAERPLGQPTTPTPASSPHEDAS
jgi:hypothetical protein